VSEATLETKLDTIIASAIIDITSITASQMLSVFPH